MAIGYPVTPLPPGCPWSEFQPPHIKYCEENLCAWITAPANTWSNLGFIFIGLWLLRKYAGKPNSGMTTLFAYAAIGAGASSFLYHASYTFLFQILDYVGMYMFSGLLLVLNLRRMNWLPQRFFYPLWVILILVGTLPFALSGGESGRSVFGLQLLISLLIEFLLYRRGRSSGYPVKYRMFWTSLGIFLMAYGVWWLDTGNIWCDPTNHVIQGHAIWHVLNAFCFMTMADFYRQCDASKGERKI